MNVLAFDTCLGALSVAIAAEGEAGVQLLAEAYEERETGHAERLMPMIIDMLAAAGLSIVDIDRIAVTVGPGSFTGVRTGIAAARGFALARGIDVVGLSSLNVIANRASAARADRFKPQAVCVAIDARREALYVQAFGPDADHPLSEPALMTPPEAAALVRQHRAIVVGTGAARVRCEPPLPVGPPDDAADYDGLQPHANVLALRASRLAILHPVCPLYLRAPDAKPQSASLLRRP